MVRISIYQSKEAGPNVIQAQSLCALGGLTRDPE